MSIPFIEENDQTQARQEHLEALRRLVGNTYPNKFERSQALEPGKEDTITAIVGKFRAFEPKTSEGQRPPSEEIELANQQLNKVAVRLAGRIASPPRVMGKAAFVHLSDGITRLQVYVRRADVIGVSNDVGVGDVDGWGLFGLLDHGDFIGVEGYLFITKTGELSIHVQKLQFLAKALLPMPDKMHGVTDPEIKQRQRYVDLIAGSLKVKLDEEVAEEEDDDVGTQPKPTFEALSPRQVFERRSKIISEMRRFLEDHGYIEVETPMLTPKATGAAARPFKTHHNALNIDLYARIAPELYLKRLLVGGFEKVYELNRNFRNEGIDRTHNPEFTMLEFYWAYADVNQMMDFCEQMIRATVFTASGHTHARYELGRSIIDIDFSQPFQRLTMRQGIVRALNSMFFLEPVENVDESWFQDYQKTKSLVEFLQWFQRKEWPQHFDSISRGMPANQVFLHLKKNSMNEWSNIRNSIVHGSEVDPDHFIAELFDLSSEVFLQLQFLLTHLERDEEAKAEVALFKSLVKPYLDQPTFISDYPKSISPLSKASPLDPTIAERFELFIAGMECANGFSELNDPAEQHQRFLEQMMQRERGDEEAMVMDEDYIRSLSYGMPPAAGIGIGIDRLVMLLTNRSSIRDVILFPHMRPERLHQFSWLKWMYEELASLPTWPELSEMQQAKLLVDKFQMWASQPDSPAQRRGLFGDSEDAMLRTAQNALRVFREV